METDYARLRERVDVPFVILDATVRVVQDVETIVTGLRRLRESMDAQDYATSTPGPSVLTILSADRVLMSRTVRHYRRDGTLLAEGANVYLLNRTSAGWKIMGTFQQDPAYAGPAR